MLDKNLDTHATSMVSEDKERIEKADELET